jgi:hypothetical protein
MMADHAQLDLSHPEYHVGELTEGGKTIGLDLREACNKIIHLDALDFSYEPLDFLDERARETAKGLMTAKPELALSGTRQEKPWKAILCVPSYVHYALIAARLFGDAKNAAEMRELQKLLRDQLDFHTWTPRKIDLRIFVDSLKDES